MKMVICKRCGKKRQHHAKGYCSDCYHLTVRPPRPLGFCIAPDHAGPNPTNIVARGLCRSCYNRYYASGSLLSFPTKEGPGLFRDPALIS